MEKYKTITFLLFLLIGLNNHSQTRFDSLLHIKPLIQKQQHNWWYNEVAQEFIHHHSYDTALWFAKTALQYPERNKVLKEKARSYYLLGEIYMFKKQYHKSIESLIQAYNFLHLDDSSFTTNHDEIIKTLKLQYRIYEEMQEFSKELEVLEILIPIAKTFNDTTNYLEAIIFAAYIYSDQGNASKGIDNLLEGIALAEKSNQKILLARIYNTLGYSYQYQKIPQKALNAYKKAYEISSEINEYMGSSICLINIGTIYHDIQKFDTSIFFLNQALQIQLEKIQDEFSIASIYANLASNYIQKKEFKQALKYITLAIAIYKTHPYQFGLSQVYYEMAFINQQTKNYSKAIEYGQKALDICLENKFKQIELTTLKLLFKTYQDIKQYDRALKYNLLYHELKDSINSIDVKKQIALLETQFEFNKKNTQIALLNNEKQLQKNKIEKQKLFLYFSVGTGVLLAIVILLIFILLQQKIKSNLHLVEQRNLISEQNEELRQQKEEIIAQKEEINKQKDLITRKNQDITDSITHAEKIQKALLPKSAIFQSQFSDFFILNLPKDIVSGDYYWLDTFNQFTYLAVIDCTGHGVPGAFMTFIAHNLLNSAIHEKNITLSHEILNYVSANIHNLLNPNNNDEEIKSGMDIAILQFDLKNKTGLYSGAHCPILHISNHQPHLLKPDCYPIGKKFNNEFSSYSKWEFEIAPHDKFYLFTDGFADQFGGIENKKYLSKKFKNKILEIAHHPFDLQRQFLLQEFYRWKGQQEQTDDILIVGVQI